MPRLGSSGLLHGRRRQHRRRHRRRAEGRCSSSAKVGISSTAVADRVRAGSHWTIASLGSNDFPRGIGPAQRAQSEARVRSALASTLAKAGDRLILILRRTALEGQSRAGRPRTACGPYRSRPGRTASIPATTPRSEGRSGAALENKSRAGEGTADQVSRRPKRSAEPRRWGRQDRHRRRPLLPSIYPGQVFVLSSSNRTAPPGSARTIETAAPCRGDTNANEATVHDRAFDGIHFATVSLGASPSGKRS